MSSEIDIENSLGYLPKTESGFMWFVEGMCAGASVVLILVAAAVYFGG